MSDQLGLTFPIVADSGAALAKSFGVHDAANDIAWPSVFIVDENGLVAWSNVASSYVYEKRPTAQQLLEALTTLRSSK